MRNSSAYRSGGRSRLDFRPPGSRAAACRNSTRRRRSRDRALRSIAGAAAARRRRPPARGRRRSFRPRRRPRARPGAPRLTAQASAVPNPSSATYRASAKRRRRSATVTGGGKKSLGTTVAYTVFPHRVPDHSSRLQERLHARDRSDGQRETDEPRSRAATPARPRAARESRSHRYPHRLRHVQLRCVYRVARRRRGKELYDVCGAGGRHARRHDRGYRECGRTASDAGSVLVGARAAVRILHRPG